MTTTANKGGLRAAATARRDKAAQRTPLPAKNHKENLEIAREAIADAKPAKRTRRVKEDPRDAVAFLEAKAPEELTKRRAKKAEPVAEAAPVKTVRKTGEVLAEKRRAKKAPVVEVIDDKAAKYVPQFEALGWAVEVERKDGIAELTARRGDEVIFLSWEGNSHASGGSSHTYADRTVKVRNPAEALRVAATAPEEAKNRQVKVSGNKQFRKRATGPTLGKLPFDPATVTAEELAAALAGRTVSWHNRYRVESETATVGRLSGITTVTHEKGHRIVSFIDPQFGFRAFRLDHLERVSGGRSRKAAA